MHFEPVEHQCTEAIRLELGCNGEENDFNEALGRERAEYTPTDDLDFAILIPLVLGDRKWQVVLMFGPALADEDGLMLPVHGEPHDVVPRHTR